MNISYISSNMSFGRALTTNEKAEFKKVQEAAKKQLGIDKTLATVFDFSVPSSNNDTGIGTTFSSDAQKMVDFLKTMCGVNAIQLQPQGQVSEFVKSPYSGTSFSLGMHIIDLNKLADKKYGNLLTEEDLKSDFMTRVEDHNKVNYTNIFGEDGQKAMLKIAYGKFKNLNKNTALKKEFKEFKENNQYWLEKDALFDAAAVANGSEDMREWSLRDQNVFATKKGDKERIAELKEVTDEDNNNIVDFSEFVQFIADKQQKESKAEFNAKGIDLYGDCAIGASQKDYWAHKSAFYPEYEFGCDGVNDPRTSFSCWAPAVNLKNLSGDAGKYLYEKFSTFFKRYDGVRVDAAWQLVNPIICEVLKEENGEDAYDDNGNKLGVPLPPSEQPVIPNNGEYIIKNIILKAADKNKIPHDKILFEILGNQNAYDSLDAVKDTDSTLIHISRYCKPGWGNVAFYNSEGNSKYQSWGDFIIGPGTHDDISLREQLDHGRDRANCLSQELKLDKEELLRSKAALSKAVFAEMFTTKNQFATMPDILGQRERINEPNTSGHNWAYRIPQNYEKLYHQNLIKGFGLNLADAYSKALKANATTEEEQNTPLIQKLDEFAKILSSKGPLTTEEADRTLKLKA